MMITADLSSKLGGTLPGRFGGRVTLIWGQKESPGGLTERIWWQKVAAEVELFEVPGDCVTKLTKHVGALAGVLNRLVERTWSDSPILLDRKV